jgi:hypothetical protein
MVREPTFGQLVSAIKAAGEMVKDMAQENGRLLITPTMKESGDLANPKVLVCIFLQTVLLMKENSKLL